MNAVPDYRNRVPLSANGVFDSEENFRILREWGVKIIEAGGMPRSKMEEETSALLRRLYLPGFLETFKIHCCLSKDAPPLDWWVGLDAWTKIFAGRLLENLSMLLPAGEAANIDPETWHKFIFPNVRAVFGDLGEHGHFPNAKWSHEIPFMKAWTAALSSQGEHDQYTLFCLARLWDTFPIPLRYFTDGAALRVLNFQTNVAASVDSYRKDIRGKRNGLDVKAPLKERVIVTNTRDNPSVLRVNRGRALACGLNLQKLPSSMSAPGQVGPLEFKVV